MSFLYIKKKLSAISYNWMLRRLTLETLRAVLTLYSILIINTQEKLLSRSSSVGAQFLFNKTPIITYQGLYRIEAELRTRSANQC
jgi:hypothetical protein